MSSRGNDKDLVASIGLQWWRCAGDMSMRSKNQGKTTEDLTPAGDVPLPLQYLLFI